MKPCSEYGKPWVFCSRAAPTPESLALHGSAKLMFQAPSGNTDRNDLLWLPVADFPAVHSDPTFKERNTFS